ncbi:MAG: hypothetical protein ACQETH_02930 [Candidatus Rifleibacteriota bacterium]
MTTKKKRGFSLYLTFLVTTVIFILVTGSYEISKISLDTSKSSAIDAVLFHAADGGLERGLAKSRIAFESFAFNYVSHLSSRRKVRVEVKSILKNNQLNISSRAILIEGNQVVSTRTLLRHGVKQQPGRTGTGKFLEAS